MNYLDLLRDQFNSRVALRERRPAVHQLIVPLYHEDGDMVDIYLEPLNDCGERVRVCDFGMTLMRLSYGFELDTPNKQSIFERILAESGVASDNGNLHIDTTAASLYPAVMQFGQTVAKVASMQLYKREILRSQFFELLTEFVEEHLRAYHPSPKVFPLPDRDDLQVDFELKAGKRPIYLFAVKDNDQARLAVISCLEFQKARLDFKSAVIHEDFDGLSKNDRARLTSAADKQFVSFEDFKDKAEGFLSREVA